jgi:phosphoribosylformylglycinamidine synthase
MKFRAKINVMPQEEILDPQGKAVGLGLKNLGLQNIEQVRVGKHITLELEAEDKEKATQEVEFACQKLLANLIMEAYSFELESI